jgi:hypothetical protein
LPVSRFPLSDFIHGFWGCGNPEGDYWFVGMEEGGSDSFEEIHARITQWDRRVRWTRSTSRLSGDIASLVDNGCRLNATVLLGRTAVLKSEPLASEIWDY